MSDPDYTHLTLIVDRSGSMSPLAAEAQAGIATLLDDQHSLPGRLTVTLVEFDDQIDTVARMSSERVGYVLEPRGMTALLDAVGGEIHRTGADLAALDEWDRPGRVLIVVVTDGQENSSHEYDLGTVRALVEHQREVYSWQFQFLGADDAAWQGHGLGMASTAYAGDAGGTRAAYGAVSASMAAYRAAPAGAAAFAMPDRVDADGAEGSTG